jgi:hypothetical protein
MRHKIPLLLAIVLSVAAILVPEKARATCDPQGTSFFKTSFCAYNTWICDEHGPMVGNPCGPPPEQNFCFLGEYNPPTTCCDGYHEVTDPENECGSCFYCRDVYYVCN